ncbi:MAG TPA: lyase family protein, partial [Candidatus Deferrimicrobium sp.]|nr:lyase family protein [Candidatus Deferrimicrobium sp.]
MQTRQEKDLLGIREIPSDVYYGIQTIRAKENFPITGYPPHQEMIVALALVKKAAAIANMEIGILTSRVGDAIVKAADEIVAGKLHNQFITDVIQGGAGTSMNMNTN